MKFVKAGLVTAALMLTAGLSQAALVDYSTQGSFNGAAFANVSSLTFGSTTLTFTGTNATGIGVNTPTNGSLGTFQLTSTNTAAGDTLSGNFAIRITQTTPGPTGTADLGATLSGVVTATSSTGAVQFSTTAVTINGVTYDVANAAFGLSGRVALVAPNTNNGMTTVQAAITGGAVPEPSTYALLGGGLISLIGLARRRRK